MTSSRADLDRLSFLDLPPEVRNKVYGYAFEHPSPIVITFSKQVSGSVTLHRYIGDSNHELPLLRSRPDNAYLPKAKALVVDSRDEVRQIYTILRPCDTVQAFQLGLPFFQTFRQVHEEASSAFYSNNTFLIMQKRLGCATKHGKKCDLAGRVLEQWCRQIRAYIKLVKHLWWANLHLRNTCESYTDFISGWTLIAFVPFPALNKRRTMSCGLEEGGRCLIKVSTSRSL
jgi:hypothetical protein